METSQPMSSIRYTSHVLGQVEAWVRPTVCYANVYRRRLQQMESSQPTSRIQNTLGTSSTECAWAGGGVGPSKSANVQDAGFH